MGKVSNRSAIERLIERTRAEEQRNNALKQVVAAQVQLTNAARSDARVEALRRRRATEASFRELAMDMAFTVEEQHVQQKVTEEELQGRITAHLEQQQQLGRIADLQRHQICMESEDIRRLKEQLQAARVNRERAAQVLERQCREADAAEADARLELAMEERRLAECEEGRRKELDRLLQLRRIGRDLVAQIEARQRAKQEQKANEYESEKEQVGAVVAKLLDEMEDERRQAMERRQRRAQMVEDATKERERQKQLLLEQKMREENEIREYLKMQQRRAEDLAREKELARKEKARILTELLQNQFRKQQEQTDYAQLVADLYEYEREEQERQKEQAQKQKRQQEKATLAAAFKEQMEEKERKRQAILEEEGKFRQELQAKFAREARLDQLTQQRRNLAILEHNRQVEAIIQERRRHLEEERQKDQEEHRKLLELESAKQAIIQQERERLLRENAELAEFLPKHTLQDRREQHIVNSARQQHGSKVHLEPLKPFPRTIRAAPPGETNAEQTLNPQKTTLATAGGA